MPKYLPMCRDQDRIRISISPERRGHKQGWKIERRPVAAFPVYFLCLLNCRITGPCRLVELGFTFLEPVTQSRDLIGCVIRRAECIVYLFVCQLSQKVGQPAAIRYSYVVENVTTFAARE